MTPEEKERQHEEKMAFARKMLLGGGGVSEKAKHRHIIGKKAKRVQRNPWAGGYRSDALGVNPDQISEATAALRAGGCMADFDKDGCLICNSQEDYNKAGRTMGIKTGRDGWDIKNEHGNSDFTGRGKVTERRRAKAEFLRRIEEEGL